MTLSRRMIINLTGLIIAVAMVGAVGVGSLMRLQRDLTASLAEHERRRQVFQAFVVDVGTPVLMARQALADRSRDTTLTINTLRQAAMALDAMNLPGFEPALADTVDKARQALRRAIGQLSRADPTLDHDTAQQIADDLNIALGISATLASGMKATLESLQTQTHQRTTAAITLTTITAACTVLIAAVVGWGQYRSVMRPLKRIGRGVERFGQGHFDERLPLQGDDELTALARQFNHMADELGALYRDLEDRVRLASRQLAQSERLASVGYLAAGVAHEINNPLAIIAGHAELALRRLPEGDPMREKLQLICDEAFRCKRITEKLLSLSRSESQQRRDVDLRQVIREVLELVATLPDAANRTITQVADAPLPTRADVSQIKQVLLNLLTNAMAATSEDGRITISGRIVADHVTIDVTDDGRGMDQPTLDRVFEPFFTSRRGTGEPGTGLGLSISHAIITEHAGSLTAHSDGPDQGSTFTIRLPMVAS